MGAAEAAEAAGYSHPGTGRVEARPHVGPMIEDARRQWVSDIRNLYPEAIEKIAATMRQEKAPKLAFEAARWLADHYRAMIAPGAQVAAAEAPEKPASEMSLEELDASIARLERLAAAEQAEDADVVAESDVFG